MSAVLLLLPADVITDLPVGIRPSGLLDHCSITFTAYDHFYSWSGHVRSLL